MTFSQAVIMGLIQVITEFIPISSSGHLVIVPHLLGWKFGGSEAFIFNVLVQWGTLFAVCIYFRNDLHKVLVAFTKALLAGRPFATRDACMGWYIIVATLPTVIAGLLFKDTVQAAFYSARATGFFLLVTALLLYIAEYQGKRNRDPNNFTKFDAIWIGCFQVMALLPGVSRSGATIAGGMVRHLDRPTAARFSFLISIPVMIGAGVLAINDLAALQATENLLMPLLVGFLCAFISGYIAIRWLISYLNQHTLYIFATYCLLVGSLSILY